MTEFKPVYSSYVSDDDSDVEEYVPAMAVRQAPGERTAVRSFAGGDNGNEEGGGSVARARPMSAAVHSSHRSLMQHQQPQHIQQQQHQQHQPHDGPVPSASSTSVSSKASSIGVAPPSVPRLSRPSSSPGVRTMHQQLDVMMSPQLKEVIGWESARHRRSTHKPPPEKPFFTAFHIDRPDKLRADAVRYMSNGTTYYTGGIAEYDHRGLDRDADLRKQGKAPFHTVVRRAKQDEDIGTHKRAELLIHGEDEIKQTTERKAFANVYNFFGPGFEMLPISPEQTRLQTKAKNKAKAKAKAVKAKSQSSSPPFSANSTLASALNSTNNVTRSPILDSEQKQTRRVEPVVPMIDLSGCVDNENFHRVPSYSTESGTGVLKLSQQLDRSQQANKQKKPPQPSFRLFIHSDGNTDLVRKAARDMSLNQPANFNPSTTFNSSHASFSSTSSSSNDSTRSASVPVARTGAPEEPHPPAGVARRVQSARSSQEPFRLAFRKARELETIGTHVTLGEELIHTSEFREKVAELKTKENSNHNAKHGSGALSNLARVSYGSGNRHLAWVGGEHSFGDSNSHSFYGGARRTEHPTNEYEAPCMPRR